MTVAPTNHKLVLAQTMFPADFATYMQTTGKQRKSARARLISKVAQVLDDRIVADLRAQGACCGKCKHFSLGSSGYNKPYCELTSDFHGYTVTAASSLCSSFRKK